MTRDALHRLPFANDLSRTLSALPAADRASLRDLSIPDMLAWSAARTEEYRQHMLSLLTLQNVLAPIHRLPPEILSRIFVEAWQDRRNLRLAHVCGLWRSWLLDTSEFWAVAVANETFRLRNSDQSVSDDDYLEAACSRSAPRNISLHLLSLSPRGHLQLIQHAGQIKSMQLLVGGRDQLERLWQALDAGMPHLEGLIIRVDAATKGAKGFDMLAAGKLPRLARLTIPARLFPYCWPDTLENITLRWGWDVLNASFMISLSQLLKSLEGYPNLRALDISDQSVLHSPRSQPPTRTFPTLQSLRIKAQIDTVSAILSHLSFPPSTHVDIEIIAPRLPQGDLFVPGSAFDAVAACVDDVRVQIDRKTLVRAFASGHERFKINISDRMSSALSDGLVPLFQRTAAPVSHFRLTQSGSASLDVNSALTFWQTVAALPRLTHLVVHSPVAQAFLLSLGPSHPLSRGSLLFPSLTDLTLGFGVGRGGPVSMSLRDGVVGSAIATLFRDCGATIASVLVQRGARGSRLSRLEFFWFEDGCMEDGASLGSGSRVGQVDLGGQLVEEALGLEQLRKLVDGAVVFAGYRFLTEESCRK